MWERKVHARRGLAAVAALAGSFALALAAAPPASAVGWTPAAMQPAAAGCARSTVVSSSAALASAVASAQPGDCVLLANGTYAGLTIARSGTAASPITVEAQNQLQAAFTGTVNVTGSYVTLQGLHFTGSGNVHLTGTTGSRVTRSLFNSTRGGHFILLTGDHVNANRIDHDELGPQVQPLVSEIFVGGGALLAQNTRIDHNYFHDVRPGPNNTNTIQLGEGSGSAGQAAHSLVEYNLFARCSGENEMIEVKSGANVIRYNTMHANAGWISLREGNGSSVYGNFYFGDGVAGAGGIRMWGADHVVYDNYIDAQDNAIDLGSGDPHPVATSHAPLIRPVVVNNTFISEGTIAVNIRRVRPVAPDHMIFANNIAIGAHGAVVSFGDKPTNPTLANNIVHPLAGATAGVAAQPGVWAVADPGLTRDAAGVQEPGPGSRAVGAGTTAYGSLVADDVFGRARPAPPTIGAVEAGSGGTRHPLTTADVGPASA
jgi:hypothetical protein